MLFFGHIAIAMLAAEKSDADPVAAIAGNLLPDVTDKTGALLRLTPGRWLAHGLPFTTLTLLLSRRFLDERRWRGFALGYVLHLIADLWAGGKVPWLAPFQAKPRPYRRPDNLKFAIYLLPEFVGAAVIWRLTERRLAPAPSRPAGPIESQHP